AACDPVSTTAVVCPDCCETAFAKADNVICFIDDPVLESNRWGWTNEIVPGSYEFEIWAGAGQCDLSKGELAGYLVVDYDGGEGTVDVTYQMSPDYTLEEVHLYVGCEKYPVKDDEPTVAPGQFPYSDDPGGGTEFTFPTITIAELDCAPGPNGELYIIAHAVVCLPPDVACADFCDPPTDPPATPADDCCDTGDRPVSITFAYTGNDCNTLMHSQEEGSVNCEGITGSLPDLASVDIVADDGKGHDWTVNPGSVPGTITIASDQNDDIKYTKLGAKTFIHIFDGPAPDHELLQSVELHTSCSQPLVIGDQFGALTLTKVEHSNGEVCEVINGLPRLPFESPDQLSVLTYPNPASSYVNLQFEGLKDDVAIIQIFDALGRLIITKKVGVVNGAPVYLELGDQVKDGMYYVRVKNRDEIKAIPIVVTKANYRLRKY
ncbi:MAG: T9SS type A sorting domain-containing protein, partial [Saprospiraceae bacterium]|nr:T9SS type A sorting domain-containing protein [Saprospiraceae bacterium]